MAAGDDAIRAALGRHHEAGLAAWPGVALALDAFVAHVASHLEAEVDPAAATAELFGADLYLAAACAEGNPAALRQFEDRILPACAAALRRLDPSPAFADEVRQLVRAKLFVTDGVARPKIADYAGRGPLASWVRVAAVRTALNLRGASQKEQAMSVSQVAALAPPVDDAGLVYLKQRFAGEFKLALARTCQALAERDKTILRLRFVEGRNIDEIGALYDVHRATVARWVARIRDEIFEGTRGALESELGRADREFESLLQLAHSQLDVSISGVLRDPAA